jgi:flagellar secretion chaperone FliS
MFGSPRAGASVYAKVGMETGVAAADPHKLIVMLFEGAMVAVASAIQHMQAGDIEKKGAAISKAIMIIDAGLRASLNKNTGGGLALNLDSLYEYMSRRLLIANLKNQPQVLEEVYQLLKGLKSAWEMIGNKPLAESDVPAPAKATPYENGAAPSSSSLAKA